MTATNGRKHLSTALVTITPGTMDRRMSSIFVPTLVAIAAIAGLPAHAQKVIGTVAVGVSPGAIAVNPVQNKIYVVNNGSNSVTVIDGVSNSITTVVDPNAVRPQAVAANLVTGSIYVANNGSNNVTVIDGRTNATTTVNVGMGPFAIAVNPVTNKVYVANNVSNDVTVIDGTTNITATIVVDSLDPKAIAVNPITNQVYVATSSYFAMVNVGDICVIDGTTNAVTRVATGVGWNSFAVNPATNKIYAAERAPDDEIFNVSTMLIIDGATNSTSEVTVGINPFGAAVNPVTNKIYVANAGDRLALARGNTVTVFDGIAGTTSTVAVGNGAAAYTAGNRPFAIGVDPVSNKIYVTNYLSNNMTVIDGATDATTTLTDSNAVNPLAVAVNPVTNKVYVVNSGSNNVTVIDGTTPGAPSFTTQPQAQTVNTGAPVALNAAAGATLTPVYRWYFNGAPLSDAGGVSGTSTSTLYLSGGATLANTGIYSCVATNGEGSMSSNEVPLRIVNSSTQGRLINISTRAVVGNAGSILISGFVVRGAGSKTLVLRAIGPALSSLGVSDILPDPVLLLYDGFNPANQVTVDSGWQNPPSVPGGPWTGKATPVDATAFDFAQVGAFGLTPGSNDSAIRITLPAGAYSSQVTTAYTSNIAGTKIGTGVALEEVYDEDIGNLGAQLVNLSSRAFVGTGDNILVTGFVVSGSTSQTLLIRASGPALVPFGVPGTLPDPLLQLFDGKQELVASNFRWGGNAQFASAASTAGAFTWNDPSSDDSAILITLPPGNYTAQVAGNSGDTGVALIEVYAMPETSQ